MARLLLLIVVAVAVHGEEPASRTAGVRERFDATIGNQDLGLDGRANPYDASAVQVDALVTLPDGTRSEQPCFWRVPQEQYFRMHFQQEQNQDVEWERFRDAGPGAWTLRLLPLREGDYRWEWRVTAGIQRWTKPGGVIHVRALRDEQLHAVCGPVHVAKRGFAYLDDQPFIPIGWNLGWPKEQGSRGYATWLRKLHAAGANATRLWLVHYYGGTALEWSAMAVDEGYAGVGRYSQEAAERVDRIFSAAREEGIQVMLCAFTFGDHNWDWGKNPYAVEAGGWLDGPAEFFTDARARIAAKNALRYTVARWGAESALWAWELWNEVDASHGYDEEAVLAWHREMAGYIKGLDFHRHLLTTSYRFPPPTQPCAAFALPEMDIAQAHSYLPDLPKSFDLHLRPLETFAKPLLIGEFGLHVSPQVLAADPAGLHIHDGLWAGVFSCSAGGALGWWWDRYLDKNDLYYHCTGISRFLADESLAEAKPLAATVDDPNAQALAIDVGHPLVWVQSRRAIKFTGTVTSWNVANYTAGTDNRPLRLTLATTVVGGWRAVVWDTFDGVALGEIAVEGTPDGMVIDLPAFRHDLALTFYPLEEGAPPLRPLHQVPTPLHDRLVAALLAAGR